MIAVSLTKIANDLALMGSGPRAGIGELFLPELQKGSSIMPGKVNPVIPEVVLQVGAQVIGNDTAITVGGLQGQFELNVRIPLIARNLLQSIALLTSTSELFAEKCVDGIEANLAGCEASAEGTLAVATALNPYIGYDKAAEIVKDAAASGRTLREVAREHGVDEATLDAALDLRKIAAGSSRVSPVGTDADLLERIEAYCDAAPRAAADVEEHGALTLFVSRIPWRYYGPPAARAGARRRRRRRGRRAGAPARAGRARGVRVGARDDAVARRRREAAGLEVAARAAARARCRSAGRPRRRPTGCACACSAPATRRSPPPRARSSSPSRRRAPRRATPGPAERDVAAAGLDDLGFLRERLRRGLTAMAVAESGRTARSARGLAPAGRRRDARSWASARCRPRGGAGSAPP